MLRYDMYRRYNTNRNIASGIIDYAFNLFLLGVQATIIFYSTSYGPAFRAETLMEKKLIYLSLLTGF